jgi:hypothetical protein
MVSAVMPAMISVRLGAMRRINCAGVIALGIISTIAAFTAFGYSITTIVYFLTAMTFGVSSVIGINFSMV